MPLEISSNYGAQPKAAPTGQQDLGSKDVFLKMLVAQMQYQDPLNPTDSAQMSSDLAQFNMVEQQIDTNKYLKQLADSQGGSNGNLDIASAGYLGHTVMMDDSNIQYNGASQSFSANLDAAASSIFITISDSAGTPVRSMSLSSLPPGNHQLTWDGKNDAGTPVLQGNYKVDIAAFDTAAQPINATIQRSGVVSAVRTTPDGIQLIVNGIPTNISNVTEVRI